MNFSAHTYEVILDLADRFGKFGFDMTDVRIAYVRPDGMSNFRSFPDREALAEYFGDTVSTGAFTKENGGYWKLCDCTLTRTFRFLPRISFRVTDACGGRRRISERSVVRSTATVTREADASRVLGVVERTLDRYCAIVGEAERRTAEGVFGDLCFGDWYWKEIHRL